MTDKSQRFYETENSIELYPELGPNTPLIQVESNSSRHEAGKAARYGTSKDEKQRRSKPQLGEVRAISTGLPLPLAHISTSMQESYNADMRAAAAFIDQQEK